MAIPMDSTDETLMIAVREGARAELGVLFDRHHRALYEFFFRMTGIRTVSEDLVQVVFDRVLKFRDTFRDENHFRAWLYRMARNAHHDYCGKHTNPLQAMAAASSSKPELGETAETLRCALLAMPEDRRELVVLSQYLQVTAEEIAELLDIELSEARVRMHRALMELRELYRDLYRDKRYAM